MSIFKRNKKRILIIGDTPGVGVLTKALIEAHDVVLLNKEKEILQKERNKLDESIKEVYEVKNYHLPDNDFIEASIFDEEKHNVIFQPSRSHKAKKSRKKNRR